MIKAYLAAILSQYEGEDIEVQYCIFEDQKLLCKESILMEYKKPAIVPQVALITLLKELEKYIANEIVIIVNDAALYEIVKGTSTTKNEDVQELARETREELNKFKNCIVKDVSGQHQEVVKWKEILQH